MVKLNAATKRLNIALSWHMKRIKLMMDSSTVHRQTSDGLSGKARLRMKAASEMLIRRHTGAALALVKEYGLDITATSVKSASNKENALVHTPLW
ncbi:hypothetical protein D918_09416 [Trichuris suis]|nr:hypothetical protein D918_09416 [Trichuris suis]